MSPTGYNQEIILKNVSSTSFGNKKFFRTKNKLRLATLSTSVRYSFKLHFTLMSHMPHVIWPTCIERVVLADASV